VIKFREVYQRVPLGDALIVYTRKLENKNKDGKERFKIELMKLNMFAKMITGEDLDLVEKYEAAIGENERPVDISLIKQAGFEIV